MFSPKIRPNSVMSVSFLKQASISTLKLFTTHAWNLFMRYLSLRSSTVASFAFMEVSPLSLSPWKTSDEYVFIITLLPLFSDLK